MAEARGAGKLVVLDAYGRLVPPLTAVRHAMGGGGGGEGEFFCVCVVVCVYVQVCRCVCVCVQVSVFVGVCGCGCLSGSPCTAMLMYT